MTMKKSLLTALALAIALCVSLSACGYKKGPNPPEGPAELPNQPPKSRDY